MIRNHLKTLLAVLLLAGAVSTGYAHGHLNAGANNDDPFAAGQGDPLFFVNGDDFSAASGHIETLTFAPTGTYAGYYAGNITFTALAATLANGGPSAYHPALGSFVEVQLESVAGPAGGSFGFWEQGAVAPTLSMLSGSVGGTDRWALSENDGSPGSDPFGHVHGRQFTATQPGLYTVGFRLFDTCDNGEGGGPIHTTSDVLYINFEAIPEPGTLGLLALGLAAAGYRLARRTHRRA